MSWSDNCSTWNTRPQEWLGLDMFHVEQLNSEQNTKLELFHVEQLTTNARFSPKLDETVDFFP